MSTLIPDKPTFVFITVEVQEDGRHHARLPFIRSIGEVNGAMGVTRDEAVANLYEVMEGYVILCMEEADAKTTIWKRPTTSIEVVAL